MEKVYIPNAKLTMELIHKFDAKETAFYRFQNPEFEIKGEYEQSFGMIYGTAEEAIEECMNENDCSRDEAEEYAILPGKSCTNTFQEVTNYFSQFDEDAVLMVFNGWDLRVSGHDGESVAEFYEPIAIFSFEDAMNFYKENEDEIENIIF